LAAEAADGTDWRQETIDDIENAMIRIGDLVAREVGVQKLARHMDELPAAMACPKCGSPAENRGQEARDLITRRGPVSVTEAKCYCPKCRQLFFPPDRGSRT
jgi:Zn finger protein HypA/HybF involved in hydrogenase expression